MGDYSQKNNKKLLKENVMMFSKQHIFLHGKEAWNTAHKIASNCSYFKEDDEDEHTSDIERSCYNCLYRRWTSTSFICMKLKWIK